MSNRITLSINNQEKNSIRRINYFVAKPIFSRFPSSNEPRWVYINVYEPAYLPTERVLDEKVMFSKKLGPRNNSNDNKIFSKYITDDPSNFSFELLNGIFGIAFSSKFDHFSC